MGALDLDSPLLLRNIQLSLPSYLQDRWTSRVGKIRKKKTEEARFSDLLEFIKEESATSVSKLEEFHTVREEVALKSENLTQESVSLTDFVFEEKKKLSPGPRQ